MKKDYIEFKDPLGRVYLTVSKSLIKGKGENMPETKQKTKKAVVKKTTKTATPKTTQAKTATKPKGEMRRRY